MITLAPIDSYQAPAALVPKVVAEAHARIAPYIHQTPVISSSQLNRRLGHTLYFKAEGLQKTGAFKARGALNALLSLKEKGQLLERVVTFSSGNHAQGVAWAAKILGVSATVIMPEYTSKIKQQATRSYGAEVILTKTRREAEAIAAELAAKDACFIHPFDNDDVIAGQGTACYEALKNQGIEPDAVVAPCGGGGLLSGTCLATQLVKPNTFVFGAEPLQANDAAISYRKGKIHTFSDAPETIADGTRSMAVSPRTFQYLQQLDNILEVDETQIIYWMQWLMHTLKVAVEPSSAVAMGAAAQWLKMQTLPQTMLVILSGGNVAPETYRDVWAHNLLDELLP